MEGERKQCKAIYLAVLNRNNFKGVTSLPCQSASFCYHPFSSSLSSFQGLGEMTSPKQQPFLQSLVYMWKLLKNLLLVSLTHLIYDINNYLYLVFVLSF